jgi:hypothetical protein
MQKLLLIVLIVFPSLLFSQNLPFNHETKKVEYTGIINTNGSGSDLFTKAKNWTLSTFHSAQDLIQTRDEDYLAIQGMALIDYLVPTTSEAIEVPVHFTLSLDFVDNKYRYTVTDIYFKGTDEKSTTIIPIEETILSRSEQEEIISKRIDTNLSKTEYQEVLNSAFNRYDQYKSKGNGTILGILQLLTNGMAN